MKAKDLDYEVGDRVWNGSEFGVVVGIPDGEDIASVVVLTVDDEAYGLYAPERWERASGM